MQSTTFRPTENLADEKGKEENPLKQMFDR